MNYKELSPDKRYRITSWYANGEEKSVEMNDPDCVITAIAAAERNTEILSYMLERDGIEIINTSNKAKHD